MSNATVLIRGWKCGVWGAALGLWGLLASAQGATFSVTPSAISNTYQGVLTLQISGLTNSEQVQIQHYLDLNNNGAVEAGEMLIDAFRIQDGGVSTIAGVTNLNVPYDRNATTGAITTTLSLSAPLDAVIGQHIFRLVSPFGNFSPQTSLLLVTNAALGQSVSGTISNGNSAPVPNAIAVALRQPNGDLAAAAVADGNGHYTFKLGPGSYGIFPVLPNYFTDQSIASQITLTNGGPVSANLFLTNGSVASTLSGQVTDATNGSTLGGAFLQLESGDFFAIAFSDANGSYSAALSPSFWRVRAEAEGLARRAYVTPQQRLQVDLTGGTITNANFALPRANALFHGRFTDNFNVPFAGIKYFASDDNDFKAIGFGDTNGNYTVAILADGNYWYNSPSSVDNPVLLDYVVSSASGVNLLPGQALHQDFVAIRATASITGQIRDDQGNPVSQVTVYANANLGGIQYSTSSETDNSGRYTMPAANGSWFLGINCCGNEGLDGHGLYDPVQMFGHPVSIPPTNAVLDITVYPTGTPVLTSFTRLSPSQFRFNLNGSVGANYTVQAATDLSLSNWFNLFSLNLTSSPAFLQDNQATNRQRFYRVLKN